MALDRNREGQELTGILGEIAKRLEELDENDKIDFQKWLEYILLAATKGSNREAVHQLLEAMQKGDVQMIHGLQLTLMELLDENSETNKKIVEREVKRQVKSQVKCEVKRIEKEVEKRGEKRGQEKGICALIESCKDFGIPQEKVLSQIKKKFSLSDNEAECFMQKYWEKGGN